jgi:hypothetical protein
MEERSKMKRQIVKENALQNTNVGITNVCIYKPYFA